MRACKEVKKILFISPALGFYGAEQSLFDLLKTLDKKRFSSTLLVPNACTYKNKFEDTGIEVYKSKIDLNLKSRNVVSIIKENFNLFNFINKRQFDLIHFNLFFSYKSFLILFLMLRLRKIKMVFHNRSYYSYDALERFCMLLGKIICVSSGIKNNFLTKRRSDIITKPSENNVFMIHDGKDLTNFVNENDSGVERLKKYLGLNGNFIIGIIGAIHENKRQDLFLRIAKEVKNGMPGAKFLIVGDTYGTSEPELSYRKKVFSLCVELGLRNDVLFTGYRNDVADILKIIDVFVLTSKKESLGHVLIEAMASGIPVISSVSEGPLDIIVDGETGFLVRSLDPKDYAAKIMLLANNEDLRKVIGSKGRSRALATFEIKDHAVRIAKLYEQMLN